MAVQGSRSKINCSTLVNFKYQDIETTRRFDIVNLDSYDIILGTPFIYQHKILIGLNPTRVVVGSAEPEKIQGESVTTIKAAMVDILCKKAEDTPLPPLREINHSIPSKRQMASSDWD